MNAVCSTHSLVFRKRVTLHLDLASTTDIPGIDRFPQVSYRLNSFFTASENKAFGPAGD
jgi:hypothetical protein